MQALAASLRVENEWKEALINESCQKMQQNREIYIWRGQMNTTLVNLKGIGTWHNKFSSINLKDYCK